MNQRNRFCISLPQQLKRVLLRWSNVLLPAALAGVILDSAVTSINPIVVLVLTCLGLVPLADLLSLATEELAERFGPKIGGLLNASFGYVTYHSSSNHN